MKPRNNSKLDLRKKTIATLDKNQQGKIYAGNADSDPASIAASVIAGAILGIAGWIINQGVLDGKANKK